MKPKYREDKATQAAALLLTLRGGKMSHLKLMKLLYIAERESLLNWRRPMLYDRYVSMDNGPVLSHTYNIMRGDEFGPGELWSKFVSAPENYEVHLLDDPGKDQLSDAEVELIQSVFERFGRLSRWDIAKKTHGFPEWTDPDGSSIPIEYKDILEGGGKTAIEIAAIIQEIENIALLDSYMGG